ncbi:MAG: PilZ domain-containing protein [Alphaproteobacteria bacterium]|nr:PilZ domain-containing protein [Alphaproteobacteria bacterium]
MIDKLFPSLRNAQDEIETEDDAPSRRNYPRRSGDACVTMLNGKIYPVENWSLGGALVSADDRLFGVNQDIDITMKFKLRGEVMDVVHKGRIIRKGTNKIALQFAPLTKKIQTAFQQVVDDYVAQRFADSQTV